jgi:hypothetical protein
MTICPYIHKTTKHTKDAYLVFQYKIPCLFQLDFACLRLLNSWREHKFQTGQSYSPKTYQVPSGREVHHILSSSSEGGALTTVFVLTSPTALKHFRELTRVPSENIRRLKINFWFSTFQTDFFWIICWGSWRRNINNFSVCWLKESTCTRKEIMFHLSCSNVKYKKATWITYHNSERLYLLEK